MVHDGHGLLQHMVTLGIGEERDLARGAQEEQAVDAGVDHTVDGALEGLQVKLLLLGQRDDHRGITPWNGESVMMSTLPLSFC